MRYSIYIDGKYKGYDTSRNARKWLDIEGGNVCMVFDGYNKLVSMAKKDETGKIVNVKIGR